MAETFKLSPSAALAEIEHGPAGLVEQVLEARTFAQRWREADKPLDERELYLDDLAELVDEIKAEVAEEEAELMVAELESWKR